MLFWSGSHGRGSFLRFGRTSVTQVLDKASFILILGLVAILMGACSSNGSGPITDLDAGTPDGGDFSLPAPTVSITSPALGLFTTEPSVTVSGTSAHADDSARLFVNGEEVPLQPDGSWDTTITVHQDPVLNSIFVELTRDSDDAVARDRSVILAGESIADGALSPESVALRVNDSALDRLEDVVGSLVVNDLDLADLVPVGTKLIDRQCFLDSFLGCLGRATVKIDSPAPSFSDLAIGLDSRTDRVLAEVAVQDIEVHIKLTGSGLIPNCGIHLRADQAGFGGAYRLEPDGLDPFLMDVGLDGEIAVMFQGFDISFDGLCDAPVIGSIIQAFMPDVEALATDAIADFLRDPDGTGPLDDPISQAAEDALAGLSITGSIGEGLSLLLDAPFFAIAEDTAGITIGTDGRVLVDAPAPGAPDLKASLHVPTEFPAFSPATPGGLLYDLGICISPSFFNQFLRTITEARLIATTVTEIDGEVLTAGTLAQFLEAYATLPSDLLLELDVASDVAPFLTGNEGPSGELGQFVLPHLIVEIRSVDDGTVHNRIAIDVNTGLDFTVDPDTNELVIAMTTPSARDVTPFMLENRVGADEEIVSNILGPLLGTMLPDLAGDLESFPLPNFLGLRMEVIETARDSGFLSIYASLSPVEELSDLTAAQ